MKVKYSIITISICVISSWFIYSCNKNDSAINTVKENTLNILSSSTKSFSANYKSGDILLEYNSQNTTTVNKSLLKISINKTGRVQQISINFLIDTGSSSYKLAIHEKVLAEAVSLKNSFSEKDVNKITTLFETFGKLIVANPKINQSAQLIQSLFLHNATLLTINRSYDNNISCNCTPHPAFFVGKVSFWCQEDYYINPETYINAINRTGYKLSGTDIKAYEYLIANRKESKLSIDKLLEIYEPKENYIQRVNAIFYLANNKSIQKNSTNAAVFAAKESCEQGQGSDLGCCGNYSGCCWVWSAICLGHDVACLNCDHWYCGPQCSINK